MKPTKGKLEEVKKAVERGELSITQADSLFIAYYEAVEALYEALQNEQQHLEVYETDLDQESLTVLREQIKDHNEIIRKAPDNWREE